ncbi:hypothetical protein B0H16DRAFT_1475288 [Mycena metata]|uniref:Uncharacterized protein n=1 Tax=Mycena metata TaxID=1033252 RepID=A0AAD7MIG7_9AGAR|nr:hypothetical protein B0H16DRAFT_1475288 [Mycena metata]
MGRFAAVLLALGLCSRVHRLDDWRWIKAGAAGSGIFEAVMRLIPRFGSTYIQQSSVSHLTDKEEDRCSSWWIHHTVFLGDKWKSVLMSKPKYVLALSENRLGDYKVARIIGSY